MHHTLTPLKYRTIWISDTHLGTRGCKADMLLDFLNATESRHLYLVGDIFDGWRLKRSWYWSQLQTEVVQAVLRIARAGGTEVVYIPGNHDEVARGFAGLSFGDVRIARDAIHTLASGERFLVLHGDEFDGITSHARWLAVLGDCAYNTVLWLNHWFNAARRRMGFGYWSLSAFLKLKVKDAVRFIDDFERTVAAEARRRRVDGVICGHIHKAEIRDYGGVRYCNDGDWVESCTALVEHHDGTLEVVRWAEAKAVHAAARVERAA